MSTRGPGVHLRENDLAECSVVELLSNIACDLDYIFQLLPIARLVWVNMFPRRVWCDVFDPKAIDIARKKVNKPAAGLFKWYHVTVVKATRYLLWDTLVCQDGWDLFILGRGKLLFGSHADGY